MTATFANLSGCTGVPGSTTVSYNSVTQKWSGTYTPGCGETYTISMYCSAGDWKLDWAITGCATTPSSSTGGTGGVDNCDPFSAEFIIGFSSLGCGCCADSTFVSRFSITITE